MAAPKILMVGAGAVGQVFALHLTRGGAAVSFLVKPTHALPAELPLLEQARRAVSLRVGRRLTHLEEVAREPWDQVWLAVPSTALAGAWLPQLLAATGEAPVVVLAPEGEARIPEVRRVVGAIPFMAWQHPLPGQAGAAAMAFWVPPLASVPLSGARAAAVASLLRRGGMRAAVVRDTAALGAPVTALLMATVLALEAVGFRLSGFRGPWPALAAAAAREAMELHQVGWGWRLLARGALLRAALWLGQRGLPFDLEAYLRAHFTKVGAQSRVLLEEWLRRGRARGCSTEALEELRRLLPTSPEGESHPGPQSTGGGLALLVDATPV